MMVIDPQEYEVKLSDSDIKTLENARRFFESLHEEMMRRKCTTAEGGYDEAPIQWSVQQIYNMYKLLLDMEDDGIYKIY